MNSSVKLLVEALTQDPWRLETDFSPEVEEANNQLSAAKGDPLLISELLNSWLQKYQTCLFGRIAAKLGQIEYCIITDSDLEAPVAELKQKIQAARKSWRRQAFEGAKSGFVIAVVSPRIAGATPNQSMFDLAKEISSLYLLEEIEPDRTYFEQVFLEIPNSSRTTLMWRAGVNYFSAHGDRRWWQDHRIPGGFALSINSVGHMVKSGMLATAMNQLNEIMGISEEDWPAQKVLSLERALDLAMRTIALAADTNSGKATELLPLPADVSELPVSRCPVELPPSLRDKNYCEYSGYYHTDHTLPFVYFKSDVKRPPDVPRQSLDFTYLFARNPDNFEFDTMGSGQQIRSDEIIRGNSVAVPFLSVDAGKRAKAEPEIVPKDTYTRLLG